MNEWLQKARKTKTMVICQSAESIKIDVSKILDAIAKEVSE